MAFSLSLSLIHIWDSVQISVLDEANKKGSLDVILPRRNELIRPRVSNIDQAVIVFAAKSPNMNLDLLDRFLLLAEEQELDIVIVINKIDRDKQNKYEDAAALYRAAGYPVTVSYTHLLVLHQRLCRNSVENSAGRFLPRERMQIG